MKDVTDGGTDEGIGGGRCDDAKDSEMSKCSYYNQITISPIDHRYIFTRPQQTHFPTPHIEQRYIG